ncbi:hypothetical protein GCT13_40570 [Paraburkholderia sp. CNPSo 3157]|uniref:Uncharacterized protein n=1 Tax=Paraburkholderia franconis TaxID=2654983 RepID=A0A7X1TKP3_9BURK|nr:hypothetical protein [Paraburkholderia franconis]MPW22917.1 hypothetical protein [Paraburkholderia franconis]
MLSVLPGASSPDVSWESAMDGIRLRMDTGDLLVLADALRRRVAQFSSVDRKGLLAEVMLLIDLVEPVLSRDPLYRTQTTAARLLVMQDNPLSALDHISALLFGCGAQPTLPPPLDFSSVGPVQAAL